MSKGELKPSDVLKWLIGTKEGRAYYRKELKQFRRDVVAAAEKHFFGNSRGELNG